MDEIASTLNALHNGTRKVPYPYPPAPSPTMCSLLEFISSSRSLPTRLAT
ncbi:unnamed protein product [Rhodiola kirilowii]